MVTSAFVAEDPYVRVYAVPALERAVKIEATFKGALCLYGRQLPRDTRVAQHFGGAVGRFRFPSRQAWAAFMYHPAMIRLWAGLDGAPARCVVPAPLLTLPN